jgi:GxxExxY protein
VSQAFPEREYPLQGLTEEVIAAAIEVHRQLGPGFVEKIYENALVLELQTQGHQVERQVTVDVSYRGQTVGQHPIDLLVDSEIVVELKSVEALAAAHKAQLRSALKAAGKRVGLLMNFNRATLKDGLRSVIN